MNGDHFGAYGDPPSSSELATRRAIRERDNEQDQIRQLRQNFARAVAKIGELERLVIACTEWNWLDEDAFETIPEKITDAVDAIVKERLDLTTERSE